MTGVTRHPTSIVTFLFTDIEGSTRLWERDSAAMWRALARHNAILGDAIRANAGHHFKTVGDAYQAAFPDPASAVAACVMAQRALHAEPWPETGPLRVRMALHLGQAEPTPEGDYLAPVLNRLARIMAAGHGGQVLISDAVRQVVAERLPESVTLLAMGRHRLRDLLEAGEIWQLVIADLPSTFPPLKSLEGFPNNLPRQPTPLIGRDDAVVAVRDLLTGEQTRLLTLTGAGGVGKTRLALAAAAESLEVFPGGIFFVALAGVEDAALVLPGIAAVLGVREGGGLTLEESVLAYLSGKRMLLVLDNLEQVRPFDAATAVIAGLLRSVSSLRILATSRAPLRIRAEREWPVLPLPVPPPTRPGAALQPITDLEANPAVALFVDRARAARPAWRMTPANAADVAEIARRLDGLPLAIELAAARIRVLAPADIVKRLGGALDLLEVRAGDRPDRQQTLRAAISWSHDLLSFEYQAAFRRLGVFSGGFTLEAAEAVLAASPDPWIAGLDAVSILVEQSLLRTEDEPAGDTRYRMLETIRAFALEKLAQGREEPAVRGAHATWAERFARDSDKQVLGPDSGEWLDRYEREHDNFRSAIAWSIEHDPADLGMRMPEAVWRFWQIRGYYTEGRSWLLRALESDAPPRLRALALEGFANLAWKQGDLLVAATAYEEALATWREADDRQRISATASNLGSVVELLGDLARARALQEEAVTLARASDNPIRLATTLNNLAAVVMQLGERELSIALLEESIALNRQNGNIAGLAASLTNLAILMDDVGDLDRAIAYIEETLAIDRQLGNVGGIADTLGNLAALVAQGDDLTRAISLNAEAREIRRDLGDRLSIAYGLESIASTVAKAGFPGPSARLFGAAQRLREVIAAPLPVGEQRRYEAGLSVTRAALPEEAFTREWKTGRTLPLDYAIAEALHIAREIAGQPIPDR